MANIVINNYCNLKCPYCFAEDIKHDQPQNMSLKEFQEIINFINYEEPISILGGEPTLHPDLTQILNNAYNYSRVSNYCTTVFTNGIKLMPYLSWFYEHSDHMHILLNYNSPQFQSNVFFKKTQEVIEEAFIHGGINNWFFIGCNIHPLCKDYSFLWDVVEKYGFQRIRIAGVTPGGILTSERNHKTEYYEKLKPTYMQFINDAIKHKITISFDCSQIPLCYFSDEEKIKLFMCGRLDFEYCIPAVDILMNHQAIPCFGNYHPVDYTKFDNFVSLKHYLAVKINIDATLKNNDGKCATCKQFENYACQGGCLAFSEINRTPS